jgi:hypothetical protein
VLDELTLCSFQDRDHKSDALEPKQATAAGVNGLDVTAARVKVNANSL